MKRTIETVTSWAEYYCKTISTIVMQHWKAPRNLKRDDKFLKSCMDSLIRNV